MKELFVLKPFAPLASDWNISGEISRAADQLTINYRLAGDLGQILIPSIADAPRRRLELWEATCFEFFLAPVGEEYYWEFNLSPSSDWNIFRLDGYRQGLCNESAVTALPVVIKQTDRLMTLDLQFDLTKLALKNQSFDMAITTVIQDCNGNYSYWALQHTGQEADFHQRSDFLLKIS
jgi:hypothetical protein